MFLSDEGPIYIYIYTLETFFTFRYLFQHCLHNTLLIQFLACYKAEIKIKLDFFRRKFFLENFQQLIR